MKKIGLFLDEIQDPTITQRQKFSKLGNNTGNMLFWHSLKTRLHPDVLPRWFIEHGEQLNLNEYKAFVTTDLIWIRQMQDFSYLNKMLDAIGDLPLIPISIGLQCNEYISDFKLHEETVKVLNKISERCVMGVRGNYTAEILSKYGIKNFKVIGCPSMYMDTSGLLSVSNSGQPHNVSMNFETFYSHLNENKIDLLEYGMENNFCFVEQAQAELTQKHINDVERLECIKKWLEAKKKCFFDINEWRSYIRRFDFSIGMRFHGNVLAMWENVPALFITGDSRTQELCEHFSLPSIKINEFDRSKPLEYYYQMADYSRFHSLYDLKLKDWEDFLMINGLCDKASAVDVVSKKKTVLYHIGHMGTFIVALLHKLTNHENDNAVFVLDTVISNKLFIDYVSNNKDKFAKYGQIFFRNDADLLNFNGTQDDYERYVCDYFDSYFKNNGIDILAMDTIYCVFDTYNAFGAYLSMKKISFDMIETFSRQYQQRNRYWLNNNHLYDSMLEKYSALSADNENVKCLWCYDNCEPLLSKGIGGCSQFSMLEKLSQSQITELISAFGIDCSQYLNEDYCEAILTSGFIVYDLKLHNYEEGYMFIMQLFTDYFGYDNCKLLIKPHPNTDYPDHIWKKYFPNAQIIPGYFPSSLVEHIPSIKISHIISPNSTGINKKNSLSHTVSYSTLFNYDYLHKFYFSAQIIEFLSPKYSSIFVCGINSADFNSFCERKCLSKAEKIDFTSPVHDSVIVYGNINGTSPIDFDKVRSFLRKSYNNVYIFLNSPNRNFFKALDIMPEQVIAFELNKTAFAANCLDKLENEFIFVYTENEELRNKLCSFTCSVSLKNTGMDISCSHNVECHNLNAAVRFPHIVYNDFDNFNALLDKNHKKINDRNLLTATNTVINNMDFSQIRVGRFQAIVNNVKFDCFFNNSPYDKLYVILGTGFEKGQPLPNFNRWSYGNYLDGKLLCIADPMNEMHKDVAEKEGKFTGWYYGNENECYLDYAAELVRRFAESKNIINENIIFWGSSSAGYASLYCASKIEYCTCITLNAQIALKYCHKIRMIAEKTYGVNFEEDDKFKRNDISHYILDNCKTKFVLFANATSREDLQNIQHLCNEKGCGFSYGVNKIKSNILLMIYDVGKIGRGHFYYETPALIPLISMLSDFDFARDFSQIKALYNCIVEMWRENTYYMDLSKDNFNKYSNVSDLFASSHSIGETLIFLLKELHRKGFDSSRLFHYGIHNSVIWGLTALIYGDSYSKSVWSVFDFPDDSVTIIDNINWNPGDHANILNKKIKELPAESRAVIIFLRKIDVLDCFKDDNKLSQNIAEVKVSDSKCVYVFSKNKDRIIYPTTDNM